jgi:hypothetical protein
MRSFSALGDDRKALASFRDEAMRDTAEAASREVLALSPVSPVRTGNYERVRAYNILAAVTLWRGDARSALAFADSADAITYYCSKPGTYVRVAALLAVGDTSRAEDALANRVWWTEASEAEALAMLGPHFDASRWQGKVAAAREHYRSCHAGRR